MIVPRFVAREIAAVLLVLSSVQVLSSAQAFAQSAAARSPTRLQFVTASPSKAGKSLTLSAEVDSLGAGAPTGSVVFADGSKAIGSAALSAAGAAQATLSAGGRHMCALDGKGGARCWGYNSSGQLGDGTLISRSTQAPVAGLTSGVVAIAAGEAHSCALTVLGAVKCWGYNGYGQLGDGTTTNSLLPVQVAGLTSGVVAIAAGGGHSCALTDDGGVKCWGYDGYGQLGNGGGYYVYTPSAIAGPATVYTALALGDRHSCALTSGGAVKCWGSNNDGEVGDGTGQSRSFPTQVFGLASGVIALTAGGSHSCALTSKGALKCWGNNYYGQVGDGSQIDRLAPVQVSGLKSGVVAASAGASHSCALLSSGGVRCWGQNYDGELGDGTTTGRLTPWPVSSLGGSAVAVASGGDFSCTLLASRATRCWGDNYYGEIGDGTNTDRLLPASVIGFSSLLRARARLSTSTLVAGWHLLRASYAGDTTHGASAAVTPQWAQ